MQFIESSILGVRSAYHRLSAGSSRPDVCLFPMIHIGTPAYYAEVKRRLETCDVVLFEGVRSFRVWMLTRAYSIASRRKRLGLVQQRDALIGPLLQLRKIHADVNSAQFALAWGRVPLWQRVLLLLGAPLYGFWVYLVGTRQSIGRRLSIEELESQRDYERFEAAPELEKALIDTRDARLIEELTSALAPDSAHTRIGVLYGAGHMRAVSRLLAEKYKYRVVESEWITVFDYP